MSSNILRTHSCNTVTAQYDGSNVSVCGWVHHRRDHGGVIFIDLRDRSGVVQVVFEPQLEEVFQNAEKLRSEFVIQVTGQVRKRPDGMINKDLNTGEIEVLVHELDILNTAEPMPVSLEKINLANEDTKLKYRYLDLRTSDSIQRFELRSKLTHLINSYFQANGFINVETPILTKATPEGARDYVVPSRVHNGQFYALPQSPQLFKQLMMMSGFEKYYQIARCFRDEDLRADRQPEFTQLDIEMSFINEEDIFSLIEPLFIDIFKTYANVMLPKSFKRLTYLEAMSKYGSDKPDLRFELEFNDISDIVKDSEFGVFQQVNTNDKFKVNAICVPNGCALSRKKLDDYVAFTEKRGAKGLGYIKVKNVDDGALELQSPLTKYLNENIQRQLIEDVGANSGDLIFICAGLYPTTNTIFGELRLKLGHDLELIRDEWQVVWITDWPLFETQP